jgi:hypothetical protein
MFITQNLVSWVKSWAGVGSPGRSWESREGEGSWAGVGSPGRVKDLGLESGVPRGRVGGLGWELRVQEGRLKIKKLECVR